MSISLQGQNRLDSILSQLQKQPDSVKIVRLNEFIKKNRQDSSLLSLSASQKIIEIAGSIDDPNLLAESLNLIGEINWSNNQAEHALNLYLRALTIAKETNNWKQTANAYKNIAVVYRDARNYKRTLLYLNSAKEIFSKNNDKNGLAACLLEIGLTYRNQRRFDKAINSFTDGESICNEIENIPEKIRIQVLIADTYYIKGDNNNAMKYYNIVKNSTSISNESKNYFSSLTGMARVYTRLGDIKKAIDLKLSILSGAEKINDIDQLIYSLCDVGMSYTHTKQFSKGEEYLNRAYNLANKVQNLRRKRFCYFLFIRFYNIKKDYKNAYIYSQKYISLNDSIINQYRNSSIEQMESIFAANSAEKENVLLAKDLESKEKQRNYFIVITALILLIALVTYNRYRIKKVDTEQLRKINSMKDTLLRIIAHDLKTPFNVIFGYTEILKTDFYNINDDEKLSYLESIRKASRISIQLLENLLIWSHSLSGKLDYNPVKINLYETVLENIYLLESNAESKKIKMEPKVQKNLFVLADENMLNAILRNLISNGIKFSNQGGNVTISSYRDNGEVITTVSDNGIGMDQETKNSIFNLDELVSTEGTAGERGTGFGLVLCKEFVTKHGGKIWVESKLEEGSKFTFSLPVAN